MDENKFNLVQLLPDFGRILDGGIWSPEGVSALIILFLIVCALVFATFSIKSFFEAKKHLKFYRELLTDLSGEQLLEKRREITNKALENELYGRLWKEFDESLVHVPQKQRLCNTLDAEHFFNTHSIARGLTENRLLAAVPGFLTAIGVIGTFAGLQMGLSQLTGNMSGSPDVSELTTGIFGMIGGASIAFLTSVWGVFTSVLFNVFEKSLERSIRRSISAFQNQVDFLYPRITAEQSLSNIEDFSRESSEKLAELDEKIGHRLQEAMQQASASIRDGMEQSLTNILGPAIEQLVNNAHSGSEKALESLLERFLDGVSGAGVAQKEMLESASKDMAEVSRSMTSGLEEFVGGLGAQFDSMVKRSEETVSVLQSKLTDQLDSQQTRNAAYQQSMNESLNNFIGELASKMGAVAEQNDLTMRSVQSALSEQIESQQTREVARQRVLNDQLKVNQNSQEALSSSIGRLLEDQKAQNETLLAEIRNTVDGFHKLSIANGQAADAMSRSATDMKASSNQLGLLSASVKETAELLGQDVSDAVKQVKELTNMNSGLTDKFAMIGDQFSSVSSKINTASGQLEAAATKAESGLNAVESHFAELGTSLRHHVQELEKQITLLLQSYAEKVESQTINRMNVWNEQTNSYIASMTDAVNAINSVVDEIDGKVTTA